MTPFITNTPRKVLCVLQSDNVSRYLNEAGVIVFEQVFEHVRSTTAPDDWESRLIAFRRFMVELSIVGNAWTLRNELLDEDVLEGLPSPAFDALVAALLKLGDAIHAMIPRIPGYKPLYTGCAFIGHMRDALVIEVHYQPRKGVPLQVIHF